jgi:predicted O-methyltransferase YrrM
MEKFLTNKTINGCGDSDRHLMTLFGIALGSKGKVFIELGVRNGDTTTPLTMAAMYNGGMVHSVDINDSNIKLPSDLSKHNKFYKSDAVAFLKNFEKNQDNNVDLVYIDDWHSYEQVKMELEILDRIVSPKTIIILHDLMYGETCPFYHTDLTLSTGQWANGGPYRAVAELNPQFWEFSTLPWGNGLTILRKKYSNKYKQK